MSFVHFPSLLFEHPNIHGFYDRMTSLTIFEIKYSGLLKNKMIEVERIKLAKQSIVSILFVERVKM